MKRSQTLALALTTDIICWSALIWFLFF